MSKALIVTAAAVALAARATVPAVAAGADDPLAGHVWRDRVLVALAPTPADRDLARQRRLFAAMGPGARERDLVLIAAIDGTAEARALRERFGGTGFRAVLIGKDGGEKLAADHPLGSDALFPLIDSMPMRQGEIKRKR